MFDKYLKLLKENSIKVTPQRLEILKYLDENRMHPTADQIYNGLKEKIHLYLKQLFITLLKYLKIMA